MLAAHPAEKLSISSEINTNVNAPSDADDVKGPGISVPLNEPIILSMLFGSEPFNTTSASNPTSTSKDVNSTLTRSPVFSGTKVKKFKVFGA